MSTHETVVSNGTAPQDPLAPIVAQLEDQLAPITAQRSQLEAQIAELLKQEQRIKAGITALRTGAPPKAAGKKVDTHAWTPSQATVDDVYAAIATHDGPVTVTQLVELTPHSRGTVEKSINELRAREKVRLVGRSGTGGARIFGTMP